jgi:hypothetical protein
MIAEGDCGAIGGMKTGRGNRSTRRKPVGAMRQTDLEEGGSTFLRNIDKLLLDFKALHTG